MIIRPATAADACRMAEIEIFNYRLNFYPIFKSDVFYFGELQTVHFIADASRLSGAYVYDDGVVKGFIRVEGTQVKKLFVEPVLQGQGIGARLLAFAVDTLHATSLWALEKNERAIRFYERHGFAKTGARAPEDGTDEYLIELVRKDVSHKAQQGQRS